MKEWLSQLSPREKMMIGIAGLLTILVVGYQFVVNPILGARGAALQSYERQLSDNRVVLDGLTRLEETGSKKDGTSVSSESLELLLSRTANEKGLEIVRLQPTEGDGVLVWFEKAEARVVTRWMTELETSAGLKITAFDLRHRNDQAALRGSVTFKRDVS